MVYPFLSPNGKYIAYIEQMGGEPGQGGCFGGVLKVVYLDSGKIKTTNYKTTYLTMDEDKSTYAKTIVSGEFPFDANKLITYKNNKYYLMDKSTNKESHLLDKSQVDGFLDWSLNGRYAIFESTKKSTQVFDAIEGEYAFVKFKDRFELHTKNGEKKVINETTPLAKGRGVPMNLIWVNDDYMAIFERTTNADYGTGKPKIYLFDRKANAIKPVIENAYLN